MLFLYVEPLTSYFISAVMFLGAERWLILVPLVVGFFLAIGILKMVMLRKFKELMVWVFGGKPDFSGTCLWKTLKV